MSIPIFLTWLKTMNTMRVRYFLQIEDTEWRNYAMFWNTDGKNSHLNSFQFFFSDRKESKSLDGNLSILFIYGLKNTLLTNRRIHTPFFSDETRNNFGWNQTLRIFWFTVEFSVWFLFNSFSWTLVINYIFHETINSFVNIYEISRMKMFFKLYISKFSSLCPKILNSLLTVFSIIHQLDWPMPDG